MRKPYLCLLVMVVAAPAVLELPSAAMAQVPAGNLFYQNGEPLAGNVSIAINNPQNMGGGGWVGGSTSTYPVYGPSPVLDGSISTGWNGGTFTGGGMANVGLTQGYYTDTTGNTFVNVPFSAIGTIQIWATEQPTPAGNWLNYPQQVSVAYTTASFNPGNGFSYNSGTLGVIPGTQGSSGTWTTIADISLVNGAAPTAPTDSTDYSTSDGWVAGAFTQGSTALSTGDYGTSTAYMDLTVDIPAGATSILISFGQDNINTGDQGGVGLQEIEAFAPAPVPEPASLSLLALGGMGLLARPASVNYDKQMNVSYVCLMCRGIQGG